MLQQSQKHDYCKGETHNQFCQNNDFSNIECFSMMVLILRSHKCEGGFLRKMDSIRNKESCSRKNNVSW